jgi:hypothetical protein
MVNRPEFNKSLPFFFFLLVFFAITASSDAQRPHYHIDATLDTTTHELTGTISIQYSNPSTRPVEKIGIHLWPNAYQSHTSALVHQKLHQGDLSMYYADKDELGGFSRLAFSSTSDQVRLEIDSVYQDIGWIYLTRPLQPGNMIELTSPFHLKIPKSFSRIGRTGRSYQLTQWYPHVAVLNEEGWHTMPYLDQGEFFNDFADYSVAINVPLNYKVAATGKLISVDTVDGQVKRVFSADDVIDFAWFASPLFQHQQKRIMIGSNEVEVNIFVEPFLNADWDSAMVYAERAIRFYSEWLGNYPYPQMTVVHTPFSRAGFMEYPMVAQISYTNDPQFLDRVITHEIGHTWLYGLLANDERRYPWMDEGLNSFLENEYMHRFYNEPEEFFYPRVVHSPHSMDDYHALQAVIASKGTLQPPMTAPERQQNDQYILSAYILPAQGLSMMQDQLGREMMQKMFRDYFQGHKFSHVFPGTLRTSFEKSCSCDLSWFFDGWLHHAANIDYRIQRLNADENKIVILNYGNSELPLALSEFNNEVFLRKQWVDAFDGKKEISLLPETNKVTLFDGNAVANKHWWKNTKPRNILPVIHLVPKIGRYERPSLSITPVIGYNLSDGGLPGVAIISDLLPQRRLKYFLMPMYGIESNLVRFFGQARWMDDMKGPVMDKYMVDLSMTSFSYDFDEIYGSRDRFLKISPRIGLRMKNLSPWSHKSKWWHYRYVYIRQRYADPVDVMTRTFDYASRDYGIHELSFQLHSDTVLQPYSLYAFAQAGKGFLRLHTHYHQHFRGKDKLRGLWIHGFAGWLPVYESPDASVEFTLSGTSSNGYFSKDYMYDEWLPGRNAQKDNLIRQVFLKDAGLKTLAPVGLSSTWMMGGGFSLALPFKVVHLYGDGAYYKSLLNGKSAFSYSSGIAVILMKDVFEVYIPVLDSKDIKDYLNLFGRDLWYERITFQANFKMANPLNLADQFQYQYKY